MVIYSYLCENVKEELDKHISNALSFYEKINSSLFVKNINSKLLEELRFRELIKYAVVFHDLGKVFYQGNFVKENCLSFIGHEFFSTILFKLHVENLAENNVLDSRGAYMEFKYPILFSILYHHHAMGYSRRLRKLSEIRFDREIIEKHIENDVPKIMVHYVSKNEVGNVVENLKLILEKTVENSAIVLEETYSIGADVWKTLETYPKLKKLALATLTILIILDYLSAYEGRKGPKLKFYNILEQHFRLLSGISGNFLQKPAFSSSGRRGDCFWV